MSQQRWIQWTMRWSAAALFCVGAYVAFCVSDPSIGSEHPRIDSVPAGTPKIGAEEGSSPGEPAGAANAVDRPSRAEKKTASSNRLQLPDGTSVPVLNGAFGAPAMRWPRDRPWSPIVRMERDPMGDEWYVHADGSKTITKHYYMSHIGGFSPVTNVFHPVAPLPPDREQGAGVDSKPDRAKNGRAKNED